jgi:hypothetical protein
VDPITYETVVTLNCGTEATVRQLLSRISRSNHKNNNIRTEVERQLAKAKSKRETKWRQKVNFKVGDWHRPHLLYWIAIRKEGQPTVYKIGTTRYHVMSRFSTELDIGTTIEIMWEIEYSDKAQARAAEYAVIQEYGAHSYLGYSPLRNTGTTEMFTHDLFPEHEIDSNPIFGEV